MPAKAKTPGRPMRPQSVPVDIDVDQELVDFTFDRIDSSLQEIQNASDQARSFVEAATVPLVGEIMALRTEIDTLSARADHQAEGWEAEKAAREDDAKEYERIIQEWQWNAGDMASHAKEMCKRLDDLLVRARADSVGSQTVPARAWNEAMAQRGLLRDAVSRYEVSAKK